MIRKFIITTISLFGMVFATDCGSSCYEDCREPCQLSDTTPPVIMGVILVESPDRMIDVRFANDTRGVCTEHMVLPGDRYCLEGRLYQKVINQCFCEKWLDIARREIMDYYRECNRPFVVVEVPDQDITDGVIQLVVREGRVGTITCIGNNYYPKEYFANLLGLSEGSYILYDLMSESIGWLGLHPFHKAELVFKPGGCAGEVDVEILAQDRKPWRVYAGVNNEGTDVTGFGRAFAGIIIDNIFQTGGILGYEYRTSYDCSKFQSHALGYTVPLYCGHVFILGGMYSSIKPHIKHFHSTGYFAGATAQYSIPIAKWNLSRWIDNITFGLEWKRLNNNLLFLDDPATPILDGGVNLTGFRVYFDKGQHYVNHSMTLSASLLVSPGEILPDQSNHDYNELQHGAKSTYAIGNFGLREIIYLPYEMSLVFKTRAQIATGTLLPCEQFILGGDFSIRGYETAEYIADNGALLTTEFFAPPWNFCFSSVPSYLLFYGFVDAGVGYQYHPLAGTKRWEYGIGVGPGVRFTIDPYLEIDLDWGIKLHKIEGGSNAWQRFNFSVTASY